MTWFYAGLAGLSVFSVLLLLVPRWHRRRWQGESNLDWLVLRREELAAETGRSAEQLNLEAELRVLDEAADGPLASATGNVANRRDWRVVGPVLLMLVVLPPLLYLRLGAIEDVRIADALAGLEDATPTEIESLLGAIEARSAARPGNVDYLSLLGEYYTTQNDHTRALATYEQLLEQFPESPEILARAAQAEFLSGERQLSQKAKQRAESALAIDPGQRSALGTLGMAAFEGGDYTAAIGYWERLLLTEVPNTPGYQMLTTIIAEARNRGGVGPEVGTADTGVGVEVQVALPEGGEAQGTVFVLARPSGSAQRMPTAVVRRDASQLPFRVRLDDAASMAGRALSSLPRVDIEVQVSPTGEPGRANASWVATVGSVEPSESARVEVILEQISPMRGSSTLESDPAAVGVGVEVLVALPEVARRKVLCSCWLAPVAAPSVCLPPWCVGMHPSCHSGCDWMTLPPWPASPCPLYPGLILRFRYHPPGSPAGPMRVGWRQWAPSNPLNQRGLRWCWSETGPDSQNRDPVAGLDIVLSNRNVYTISCVIRTPHGLPHQVRTCI